MPPGSGGEPPKGEAETGQEELEHPATPWCDFSAPTTTSSPRQGSEGNRLGKGHRSPASFMAKWHHGQGRLGGAYSPEPLTPDGTSRFHDASSGPTRIVVRPCAPTWRGFGNYTARHPTFFLAPYINSIQALSPRVTFAPTRIAWSVDNPHGGLRARRLRATKGVAQSNARTGVGHEPLISRLASHSRRGFRHRGRAWTSPDPATVRPLRERCGGTAGRGPSPPPPEKQTRIMK